MRAGRLVSSRRRPAPFAPSDLALVLAGALALAAFEGPVSLRKLRALLSGVPSDVSLARLLAGRLVWTCALVPLLLVLWRLGARELERRRGLDGRTALTAEALPFAPFVWLAAGLVPGWGDTVPEAWSFAMLFVFLGAVATSSSLRVATWHAGFAVDRRHRGRSAAIFALLGALLLLATRLALPFDTQPHWSTLADRSPYWPTRSYVALWTAWATWLSVPPLVIPGALLRAGRPAAARVFAVALSGVAVGLASLVASADRAAWDARAVSARYVAGETAQAVLAGHVFTGRVVGVPGAARWTWRHESHGDARPARIEADLSFAALPEAGLWYRQSRPMTISARATSGGVTSDIATWRLEPRRVAADRGVRRLERELVAMPGRDLVVELRVTSAASEPAGVPILATVTLRPVP